MTQEEWEDKLDKMPCSICNQHDQRDLLLCDNCNRGFHFSCLDPPLDETPSSSWYCHDCTSKPNMVMSVNLSDEQKQEEHKKKMIELVHLKKKFMEEADSDSESAEEDEIEKAYSEKYHQFYNFLKQLERDATKELLEQFKGHQIPKERYLPQLKEEEEIKQLTMRKKKTRLET